MTIIEQAKKIAFKAVDFSNVFQAKTAWEMGFDAATEIFTRKHVYWGAGQPGCPPEIKAGNGELHTLRCKVCGLDSPKSFCLGEKAADPPRCGKICATRQEYEEGRCTLEEGHAGSCHDANAF
jgi:hypothetical protein